LVCLPCQSSIVQLCGPPHVARGGYRRSPSRSNRPGADPSTCWASALTITTFQPTETCPSNSSRCQETPADRPQQHLLLQPHPIHHPTHHPPHRRLPPPSQQRHPTGAGGLQLRPDASPQLPRLHWKAAENPATANRPTRPDPIQPIGGFPTAPAPPQHSITPPPRSHERGKVILIGGPHRSSSSRIHCIRPPAFHAFCLGPLRQRESGELTTIAGG